MNILFVHRVLAEPFEFSVSEKLHSCPGMVLCCYIFKFKSWYGFKLFYYHPPSPLITISATAIIDSHTN